MTRPDENFWNKKFESATESDVELERRLNYIQVGKPPIDSTYTITTNSPVTSPKSDRFEPIFDEIRSIINAKSTQYATDPITVLSLADLLTQIKIKAIRAQLTCDTTKLSDELLDIIVYCMLTLDKTFKYNECKDVNEVLND